MLNSALLHKSRFERSSPYPRTDLSYRLSDEYAESGVAAKHSDADLDLCDLPIEVFRHEALAQQLHAMHLGLDAATAVISAPSSPERSAQVSRRVDRLVLGDGSGI